MGTVLVLRELTVTGIMKCGVQGGAGALGDVSHFSWAWGVAFLGDIILQVRPDPREGGCRVARTGRALLARGMA